MFLAWFWRGFLRDFGFLLATVHAVLEKNTTFAPAKIARTLSKHIFYVVYPLRQSPSSLKLTTRLWRNW